SLYWFIARPEQRNRGLYLIPALVATLAKPPALIFPLILLAYLLLFEWPGKPQPWYRAALPALPAVVVSMAAGILIAAMTPATFNPGVKSASLYLVSQPWVVLHYFISFFLPIQLSADAGWPYVRGPFSLQALAGGLFVLALMAAIVVTARQK